MKKRIIPVVIVVLLGAGAAGYWQYTRNADRNGALHVSGNIELTDAQLSFKIPGRLLERLVDEGTPVTQDQLLARLDPADQELAVAQAEANLAYAKAVLAELLAGSREQEIRQAKAAVDLARASLEELERGSRPQEIASAEDAVAQAKAESERLETDRKRYEALLAQGAVSTQQYDAIRTAATVAAEQYASAKEMHDLVVEGPRREKIEQARAALKQAEERYALVAEGPRVESIEQARAKAGTAEEQLKQAKQMLAYTELHAPFDGIVLSKSAEPGEYLNPGTPVVTVGEMDRVWLRAYINETDLGRVRLGQKVQVTTDSFPGKTYEGTLGFLSSEAEFTPKTVQTFEERVKMVYRVKIDLENPDQELKLGMPADAVIEPAS
ncbi:MAG: efflux RND transporter periplasmic adaptor subunit [Candidatus Hydrogenedentes bacterium]|nr:efflux RND transporter periplasmic adaptor subunit [Candidatus Hydrogenedentota bacterium]